jgi:exopolyphosphatase/guanosine-5'-triphosphate,3'-diphosphate pyrophosphatase
MGVSESSAGRTDGAAGSAAPAFRLLAGGKPGASERTQTAAVIDLGSNSWRLVAYRCTASSRWCRIAQLQEPVRIVEQLDATGVIGEAALARGLETLAMFARWCAARGIPREDVTVVATSAIRDAANRDEIVARAARVSGFDVRVLSSEQEARYGYLAAVNATTLADGVVLDLGGGSLQLVAVRDRRWRGFRSWPLGAVRVTERLIASDGAISRKQLKRARAALRAELSGLPAGARAADRVVAMGGAVRNLAAAHQRALGIAAAGVDG